MNTLPKISIVTPVFNGAEYLEETINSVLSQGYSNLEYIIIDGGSTDGTLDIIKSYEDKLFYWSSEPDGGMYDAIRKGFEHSSGDVLAWLNSDDTYHTGALSVVGDVFMNFPDIEWIEGIQSLRDGKGRTYSVRPHSGPSNKYDLYLNCSGWIQQESCFWRRTLYERVGGINPDLRLAGDFDLWLKFFDETDLYFVDALIGGFRCWSDKQLSACGKYDEEINKVLASHRLSKSDKKILSKYSFFNHLNDNLSKFLPGIKWTKLLDLYKRSVSNREVVLKWDSEINDFRIVNLF